METACFKCTEIDVTPTLAGSGAYSAGQQIGTVQTLTKAAIEENRITQLETLTIIDVDNQKSALSILLFNQNPTVTSVDQGTFAITAANLKAQCVGKIAVATTDYVSAGSKAVATIQCTNAFFQALTSNGGTLYAAVISAGTPTYASASSLVFKWVFAQHI